MKEIPAVEAGNRGDNTWERVGEARRECVAGERWRIFCLGHTIRGSPKENEASTL